MLYGSHIFAYFLYHILSSSITDLINQQNNKAAPLSTNKCGLSAS